MHKKYIALIITIALVNQISGFNTDHMKESLSYNQPEKKDAKEESKINEQKLSILQEKLKDTADTEKKLILSKGYTTHEDIGFYLTLACAVGAGAAFVLTEKDKVLNTRILAPSLIIGTVGAGFWLASSYKQKCILRNLTEETKETLHAISNVKQH